MDFVLSEFNKKKRNNKKIICEDLIIRKREKLLHVCLNSPGCRYRKSGSCTMCDYGQGNLLTEERIRDILPHIKEATEGMQSILIGTLGSVLDSEEISRKCLEIVCDMLNKLSIETIIFETHYTMIDDQICQWLKCHLPQKDIVIEVGLESVDSIIQEKCLNKKIDIEVLKSKIELLHAYGMSITANVFLGAPFLTVGEQIEDTENTIRWAIDNGIDSVVVFPANIRENTLLDVLYKNEKYFPIQHWAIFELLCRIPLNYLNRVYLAWYGDWFEFDEKGERTNLPPYSCDICSNRWMEFYHEFLSETDNAKRRRVLQMYRGKLMDRCGCYGSFEQNLIKSTLEERKNRIDRIRDWIGSQFVYTAEE